MYILPKMDLSQNEKGLKDPLISLNSDILELGQIGISAHTMTMYISADTYTCESYTLTSKCMCVYYVCV